MNELAVNKECSKCKIEKPLIYFPVVKRGLYGVGRICKDCISIYMKQYRIDHEVELKEKQKIFNLINREKRNKMYHEIYMANREVNIQKRRKYYAEHKEQYANFAKLYRKTINGKNACTKARHKRRALKLANTVENFSPTEIFERDGYICQICKIKTRPDIKSQYHPKRPELDHITPLSRGGEHSKLNCQCLCRTCNCRKNNREDFGDQLRIFG